MTIVVRYCDKSDLFITMTYNVFWPEIIAKLLSDQTAQDRSDLVARVFKLKLNALLQNLTKKMILDKIVGFIYVIEFQKRDLSHAHILLILHSAYKSRTSTDIDSMMCAEILSDTEHSELYDTIVSCMLHGPCDTVMPNASCM